MAKKQTPKLPKTPKKVEETKEKKEKEASETLPKSEGNGYDKIIKENLEQIFRPLIQERLGVKFLESIPLKDKMQTTIEVEMDSFYDVVPESGEPFILHLEFESGDNAKMVYRVSEYHGIALKEREREIKHIVIYLGLEPPTMRTTLKPEEVFTGFDLLNVHDLDTQELLSSQVPEVVLLAVLANYPEEDTEKTLNSIILTLKKLAHDEHELKRHIKQLMVLSRLRKINHLTVKKVNEMSFAIDVHTDVLYVEGKVEGKVEGIKESIDVLKHWQKGMKPQMIANVLNLPIKEVEQIIAEFLKD